MLIPHLHKDLPVVRNFATLGNLNQTAKPTKKGMDKYILKLGSLEIGDIILSRSNSEVSQLVRKLTKSQYSHARLYVGVYSSIESDGYGVQANNLQRVLFDNPDDVVVLRLKDRTAEDKFKKIEFFARQKIGTQYSTSEAKLAMLRKEQDAKEPNRQFCTRFVAQSYDSAGLKLIDNSDYCVPEDLLNSDLLYRVEDLTRKASSAEVEFAESENPLVEQAEVHNRIFSKAREMSGKDIQTFEQLSDLIVSNPEFDEELTAFIEGSGYLYFTDRDKERNPWHYNAKKMIEHYKDPKALVSTAMFFAKTEPHTRERLILTIMSLKSLNEGQPRKYFNMLISLYEKLIKFSEEREVAAVEVLKHI